MSDIWVVNGKTWYSGELVDKVIELCKKYHKPIKTIKSGKELGTVAYMEDGKIMCKVEPVVWQEIPEDKSLADEILELLEVESED